MIYAPLPNQKPINSNGLCCTAEFRGPGIHHRYDDSPDDLDMDLHDHRSRQGGPRIILLGDGSNLSSDSHEGELFDHDDEDEDLENQLSKKPESSETNDPERSQREGTPGPTTSTTATESPSSTKTETSERASSEQPSNKGKSVREALRLTAYLPMS